MTISQAKKFIDLTTSIRSFKGSIAAIRRSLKVNRKNMRIAKAKKITDIFFTYEDFLFEWKENQEELDLYVELLAKNQKKLATLNEEIRKSFK